MRAVAVADQNRLLLIRTSVREQMTRRRGASMPVNMNADAILTYADPQPSAVILTLRNVSRLDPPTGLVAMQHRLFTSTPNDGLVYGGEQR